MSTVDDWLALHHLPKQDLNDWLQECQKHADVMRHDGLEDDERSFTQYSYRSKVVAFLISGPTF